MTMLAPVLDDDLNTFARKLFTLAMAHCYVLYVYDHQCWFLLPVLRHLKWGLPRRATLVVVGNLEIGRVEGLWHEVLCFLVHHRLAPRPWLALLALRLGLVSALIPILGLVALATSLIVALSLTLAPPLVAAFLLWFLLARRLL